MHHLPSFPGAEACAADASDRSGHSHLPTPTVARSACSHPFSHRGLTATGPTRRLARARPQRPSPPARPHQPAAGGRCPRRRPPGATPRRPSHTPHGVTHHGATGMVSVQTWPSGPWREEPSSADQRSPRQTPGTRGSRRCAEQTALAPHRRVECRQLQITATHCPLWQEQAAAAVHRTRDAFNSKKSRTARSGRRSSPRRSPSTTAGIPRCTRCRRQAPDLRARTSSGGTTFPAHSQCPSCNCTLRNPAGRCCTSRPPRSCRRHTPA